jgi:nicotinamide mononucleotide transporter
MLTELWQSITKHGLEIFGFVTSIAGVWLTAKEKTINWPIGIIASAVYIYIFYKSAIYGDAALQIVYVIIGFYGWYEWVYGRREQAPLHITRSPKNILLILLIASLAGWLILGKSLTYTNTNVPFWDAFNTVLSLVGTWMMAKKFIENWLVWIVVDISYVVQYFYKDLNITAVLYFIFILLAIYGYFQWRKQLKVSFA